MPRTRSLLTSTAIDSALSSHNCRGNRRHRIQAGDRRLKVKAGRNWDHYCLACAGKIVERDRATLAELADALDLEV